MNKKSIDIFKQVENTLQEMEHHSSDIQISIPHRVMSYARTYQKQLAFLDNSVLKKNISYLLMLNDLNFWIGRRFSLVPGIKDMLYKNIITNFGFAIEGINKSLAKKLSGSKEVGFDSASTILKDNQLITEIMRKEIRWIYDIRNKQHYDTLPYVEFEHYTERDCKKARRIWNNYLQQVQSHSQTKK